MELAEFNENSFGPDELSEQEISNLPSRADGYPAFFKFTATHVFLISRPKAVHIKLIIHFFEKSCSNKPQIRYDEIILFGLSIGLGGLTTATVFALCGNPAGQSVLYTNPLYSGVDF